MDTEELLRRYAAGERDFAGIMLSHTGCKSISGADLRQINLRGAILSHIRIDNTDLRGADLRGTQMVRSRLTQVDLSEADLRFASLTHMKWLDVNLTYASLQQANLIRTYLRADLFYTNLEGTILTNTSLRGSTNIRPFRVHDALIWNLEMPDGTIDVGPRFEMIE
jgi:uncharacterized protein YjbI with pentapeptide repeats